ARSQRPRRARRQPPRRLRFQPGAGGAAPFDAAHLPQLSPGARGQPGLAALTTPRPSSKNAAFVEAPQAHGRDFMSTHSTTRDEALGGRKWWVVDVAGLPVGRVASQIACILRGKHKPSYTPSLDVGDFVVVVNAEKIRFTGTKEQ